MPQIELTGVSVDAFTPTQPADRTQTIERLRRMSQALPDVGFLLSCILLLHQVGWLNAAQVQYFQGPVIFGKTRWIDTLPSDMTEKLMQAVRLERFWLLLEEAETGKVTQRCVSAEIVCALQPYTLVAPLPHDQANVLVWAFTKMMAQHPDLFGTQAQNWNVAIAGMNLYEPEPYTLQELQTKIRRRVVALAPKLHPAKSQAVQTPANDIPTATQIDVFELL